MKGKFIISADCGIVFIYECTCYSSTYIVLRMLCSGSCSFSHIHKFGEVLYYHDSYYYYYYRSRVLFGT